MHCVLELVLSWPNVQVEDQGNPNRGMIDKLEKSDIDATSNAGVTGMHALICLESKSGASGLASSGAFVSRHQP